MQTFWIPINPNVQQLCIKKIRRKLCVLPIENLSMVRETNLVYHKDFPHTGVLKELTATYRATAEKYE